LQAEIANIKLEILQKQEAQSKRKKTKGQGRRHKVRHHHFYEWEKFRPMFGNFAKLCKMIPIER